MTIKYRSTVSNIPEEYIGRRTDFFLTDVLSDYSRTQIQNYIKKNHILLHNEPFKPSRLIEGNEIFEINIPVPEPTKLVPQKIDIEVIFEDKDIIAVNKPAGLTVHPGAGIKQGTLVNALLHMCKDLSGIGGELRPGIVHRLDKETSGVIVAAKNDYSHNKLSTQFKNREVKKKYVCIVHGNLSMSEGKFSSSIERDRKNRVRMTSTSGRGRTAVTCWKVIKNFNNYSYVEVEPKTGRTHQIRVHFSDNGHPILEDKVYGYKKNKNPYSNKLKKYIKRHALHALELQINHPRSNQILVLRADIPDDMMEVIKFLENQE